MGRTSSRGTATGWGDVLGGGVRISKGTLAADLKSLFHSKLSCPGDAAAPTPINSRQQTSALEKIAPAAPTHPLRLYAAHASR